MITFWIGSKGELNGITFEFYSESELNADNYLLAFEFLGESSSEDENKSCGRSLDSMLSSL